MFFVLIIKIYSCNLQDAPDFAPGTQKKVTGEVIRWNNVSGPEKIDAIKYTLSYLKRKLRNSTVK